MRFWIDGKRYTRICLRGIQLRPAGANQNDETALRVINDTLCNTRPLVKNCRTGGNLCFDEATECGDFAHSIFEESSLAVSIVHIGLPLDHPSIPEVERPKITKRLSDLKERMTREGYKYEILHASPETGLDGFKDELRTQPCDGVLIGGGVVGDPAMSYFLEQIIDAAHEVAPQAKIMFFNHSVDVRVTVERWFGSRSGV